MPIPGVSNVVFIGDQKTDRARKCDAITTSRSEH